MEQVRQAADVVDDARAALVEIVLQWIANLDTTDLTRAYTAWQSAVEAYNEVLENTLADVTTFMEDHSERWQESERGRHFADVAQELDGCQVSPEADSTLELTIDLATGTLTDNSADLLPEVPELPDTEA